MERNLNSKGKLCKISAYKRNTAFSRFMSWIFAGITGFLSDTIEIQKHHIVYVTNPPFGYPILAFTYKPIFGNCV
jgi:hypothetical protein